MPDAIVLGTFDGVHIGHRAVIDLAKGYDITAVTFKIPPKFFAKKQELLMSEQDRISAIKELGVKNTVELDFDKVKNIRAEDFLSGIIRDYSPSLICCGFNYRFGKDLKDKAFLSDFCRENGIDFSYASEVKAGGKTVSSTLIRELIAKGDMSSANKLLYKPFGFTAVVVNGDMRGRMLGFPTANQEYPDYLAPIKNGVYVSRVNVDGNVYKGISNIGVRPTFKTDKIISETHIIGFSGDIYGKEIRTEPLKFLREEKKFSQLSDLKEAIRNDLNTAYQYKI